MSCHEENYFEGMPDFDRPVSWPITPREARLEDLLRCCLVALYERQVERELTEEIEAELAKERGGY